MLPKLNESLDTSDYSANYLDTAYVNHVVKVMVKQLRSYKDSFDSIAIRGLSGALVGAIVAQKMKKHLIVIRKDISHSSMKVEGYLRSENYIIIDDLTSTGTTIDTIKSEIKQAQKILGYDEAKLQGIAFYNTHLNQFDEYLLNEFECEWVTDVVSNFKIYKTKKGDVRWGFFPESFKA